MSHNKVLKIILAGLDNAGKTSLVTAISKMYEIEEEIINLKPTIRINHYRRNFLGYQLNIMDMGGQKKFRESYIKRSIYFEQVDCFIYLFDLQSPDRIPESMKYLDEVLKVFNEVEYNKDKTVKIIFSKNDKNKVYVEDSEYNPLINETKTNIKSKFDKFKFEFFTTSIYNVYSIVNVISRGINSAIEKSNKITDMLENYSKLYNLNQTLLYDDSGLIIGEFSQNLVNFNEEFCCNYNKLNEIISHNLEYFKKVTEESDSFQFFKRDIGNFLDYGYKFGIDTVKTIDQNNTNNFFVTIITHKENPKKEDWNTHELIEKVKNILF